MRFQVPRGIHDVLPDDSYLWQNLQDKARQVFRRYNYKEIVIPILEDAKLFIRSLGPGSEVVEKQMFLVKRQDATLALRPEGTASVVRAYLENNLDRTSPFVKLFYMGAMFRAERPQKGRLRQFFHLGAEVIGSKSPFSDTEIICLANDILISVGVSGFKIRINTLGSQEEKKAFAQTLRKNLKPKLKSFCKDCQARFQRNVFRLLDCKNEHCHEQLESLNLNTPDYLSKDSLGYFNTVKTCLKDLGINFVYDPYLVRGLDYYTGIVFEIIHPSLGAQDALGAGGRYDTLVKDLGGPDTGASGFALGLERLLIVLDKDKLNETKPALNLYIAALDEACAQKSLGLAQGLRNEGISVEVDFHERSLDKKISRANKLGAKFVCILGENELRRNVITIKELSSGKQEEIGLDVKAIKNILERTTNLQKC